MPVNNHNIDIKNNNNSNNNSSDVNKANNLNNINLIKSGNIFEDQNIKNKENLNICLDNISNCNKEKNSERQSNLITNGENKIENNNNNINRNNRNNIQTKSAEQTTRNPKYFKNESIYNTNYIINFIDSNEVKNGKLVTSNKIDNKLDNNVENNIGDKNNQIFVKGQKDKIKKNSNNNAYKELTDITKNNLNEILSKKNVQKNSCDYKNPEQLHFSMVKIYQNINLLKGKF